MDPSKAAHSNPAKMREEDRLRLMRKNKLYRRIEADIRERDRKRKPGKYSVQSLCETMQHTIKLGYGPV